MRTVAWLLVGISGLAGAVVLLGACILGAVLLGSHDDSDRNVGLGMVAAGALWAAIPVGGWYLAFRARRLNLAVLLLFLHVAVGVPLTGLLLSGAESAARP